MNSIDRTAMMEHLAVTSALTLRQFCDRVREILKLPEFQFDFENETEWGLVEVDNIEYNISRPYEEGTLQEWDDTVPAGCNFGISLVLYREHPYANDHDWAFIHLVAPVAQKLADGFSSPIHYHRTWLGPGDNVRRNHHFHPDVT